MTEQEMQKQEKMQVRVDYMNKKCPDSFWGPLFLGILLCDMASINMKMGSPMLEYAKQSGLHLLLMLFICVFLLWRGVRNGYYIVKALLCDVENLKKAL